MMWFIFNLQRKKYIFTQAYIQQKKQSKACGVIALLWKKCKRIPGGPG
jgi:hypothetical protein